MWHMRLSRWVWGKHPSISVSVNPFPWPRTGQFLLASKESKTSNCWIQSTSTSTGNLFLKPGCCQNMSKLPARDMPRSGVAARCLLQWLQLTLPSSYLDVSRWGPLNFVCEVCKSTLHPHSQYNNATYTVSCTMNYDWKGESCMCA